MDLSQMSEWLNANTLFASLLWGSIGFGYFVYGRKQGAPIPLIGGIALMAASYLVADWLWMSLISIGLMAGIWLLLRRSGY
jgi:hypothetical protein